VGHGDKLAHFSQQNPFRLEDRSDDIIVEGNYSIGSIEVLVSDLQVVSIIKGSQGASSVGEHKVVEDERRDTSKGDVCGADGVGGGELGCKHVMPPVQSKLSEGIPNFDDGGKGETFLGEEGRVDRGGGLVRFEEQSAGSARVHDQSNIQIANGIRRTNWTRGESSR